ncbi:MAG: sensor histidine kinase [Mycobacteriales bacterium]
MSISWRPRTVRMRLTLLYSGLFLGSGFILLGIVVLLVTRQTIPMAISPDNPPPGLSSDPDIRMVIYGKEWVASSSPATVRTLVFDAGIALTVMAGLSAGLGWWVAGRALRPLRTMTAATRRISERNLHERLAVPGPRDELTDLGETIDSLLGRLEAAFEGERRFVANASHELRTPLTMMRTSVDVAEGKAGPVPPEVTVLAAKLREGLDLADRLLEGLLLLARAQHGSLADRTTVSLAALASAALDARAGAVAECDLTVETSADGTPPPRVLGNETLLARMVDNVIDNAVRHNEPAGWVRVATGTGGGYARLTVESGGPRLDQDAVEQLGQPFRRLGAERTSSAAGGGTGLGLSIVGAIAAAHSGRLTLRARDGGGLRVLVELPLASTPLPDPAVPA